MTPGSDLLTNAYVVSLLLRHRNGLSLGPSSPVCYEPPTAGI
jgi:hypothetical protein